MQYMKAVLIAQAKEVRDDGSIVEIVVWELAEPLSPCTHPYKYRLFFGLAGECYVRYDNERGKGVVKTGEVAVEAVKGGT